MNKEDLPLMYSFVFWFAFIASADISLFINHLNFIMAAGNFKFSRGKKESRVPAKGPAISLAFLAKIDTFYKERSLCKR